MLPVNTTRGMMDVGSKFTGSKHIYNEMVSYYLGNEK